MLLDQPLPVLNQGSLRRKQTGKHKSDPKVVVVMLLGIRQQRK
jgi:hypothetical protein